MKKILTLIVPSYNMEAYLPRCIDSLGLDCSSVSGPLEVIIVNDGSKDRTSEIAHNYETKFPESVRVIDKPNGHYGSCVNAALSVAQGTFVKLLDADDYFDREQFRNFLEELSALETGTGLDQSSGIDQFSGIDQLDAIVTDYSSVDEAGHEIANKHYNYQPLVALGPDEFQRELTFHILHQGITFRTSLFASIDYRQTEGCAYTDLEWVTYPIHSVRRFYYLPLSIYRYYIGREDQSVNPENFKKGVGTIAKLMRRMLGDYTKLLDPSRPAIEQYVQKVIAAQLNIVYHSYLIERNPYLKLDDVLALDDAVGRNAPELYKQTDAFLADSRRFAFHYVREFRHTHSRNSLKFQLLRLYSWLARLS